MERWKNKVAVVTGASSGIGAACATHLTKCGMIVVGFARRKENIYCLKDKVPNEVRMNLHAIKCDVSNEHDVIRSFAWVVDNFGGIDVLVHSAGVIEHTELLEKGNTKKIKRTIDVNILGTFYCVKEAVNSMIERDVEGHIIVINSIAGHVVPNLGSHLPSLNIYPATKFALTAMVETYRQELQKKTLKVRISVRLLKIVSFISNIIIFQLECESRNGGHRDTSSENPGSG